MNTIPQPGQVWEHYSGNRFTVVLIANEGAVDRDKCPMTAVFQDDLGRVWALPLYEFYRRFTPVDDIAVRKEAGAMTLTRITGRRLRHNDALTGAEGVRVEGTVMRRGNKHG